jgi:hypothetical protein
MATYYTVYKTTNTVNGKYYIGVHQTDNLEDDYLGSGKLLKRALEKYGREAFRREYLAIFDSAEEMFSLEGELVTESLVVDAQCYNLKEGGHGGWQVHNQSEEFTWARRKGAEAATLARDDAVWRSAMSEAQRLRWKTGGRPEGFEYDWTGKTHKEETKRKIGEANRKMVGEKNSQFGKSWVYNEELKQSNKVAQNEIEELLLAGWKRGRKMKF